MHRVVLVSAAGGVNNRPLGRALKQMAVDGVRESPKMARVAVPDYLRFGLINSLNLLGELTRFPSLERLVSLPVPALGGHRVEGPTHAAAGPRAGGQPDRARTTSTVVLIEGAAHAMNFSHPGELGRTIITSWLDDEEIVDDPDQPGLTRVLQLPRG